MAKTALLFGGGESKMYRFQNRHRMFGLGIGQFRVEQLFSLVREVDDGSIAAPNHCLGCVRLFTRACWGFDLGTRLEAYGPATKVADMIELYKDGQFFLSMYHEFLAPAALPHATRAFHALH